MNRRATIRASATGLAGSAPALACAADPAPGVGGMLQILPGLGLVIVLILACAWAAKRLGAARPSGDSTIRVVAGQSVGARERVVVVEIAGQWLVLGVAQGRVNTLGQVPKPADGAAPLADFAAGDAGKAPFAVWLQRALKKS